MGLPLMEILTGNSTSARPLTFDVITSSNFPQTLLYIVTVTGISEFGGKSPQCGLNTIAKPLLLLK